MSELHQLVHQIATGSSSQKRRAWSHLFDAGNFWSSCREAAGESTLDQLARTYEWWIGPWDRRPIQELLDAEGGDEDLSVLCDAAARTLAAAGVTSLAAADASREIKVLSWWAERAVGGGAVSDLSLLPPAGKASLGEEFIRHCMRSIRPGTADRQSQAAAQDTALSLFYGSRTNEARAPVYRLRVPILLARGTEGFLAWLWLEQLPGGFGQFFQAPDTRFDPLRRDLRDAVTAAFQLIEPETPLPWDEDIRWWLSSLPGSRFGSPISVSGASLQAATAVGLLLLLEEHPYNPTFAVSATLQEDGTLGAVTGLSGAAPKLRAALRLRSASGHATVVVSPGNQPAETTLADWEARGVHILTASTLLEAAQIIRVASAPPAPPAPSVSTDPGDRKDDKRGTPAPPPTENLHTPSGVLPLNSPFYVVRPTDAQFASAIDRQDSIVRIKGAREMGKTSLLARGLQQARAAGATVVLTDCQMFNAVHLESAETFLSTVARWFIRNLKLDTQLEDVWDPLQGPNWNFRDFLLGEVLGRLHTPLVWGLDEVDRLFPCEFGSEIFGLFRSWHNERALDPAVPWSRLTIAMAHATEAHLFITEPHQSPFNVGTRVTMEDFTREEVADLNGRYGQPLRTDQELDAYCALFGGQPYLTHRGLHEMTIKGLDFRAIEKQAQLGEGIFSEHLGRLMLMLAENKELCDAVRGVMHGTAKPSTDAYQRLWSAGILTGGSARDARLRCELYGRYLEQRLP